MSEKVKIGDRFMRTVKPWLNPNDAYAMDKIIGEEVIVQDSVYSLHVLALSNGKNFPGLPQRDQFICPENLLVDAELFVRVD